MFKMHQLVVGILLFLSSLFSCQQQKGDFKSMNVEEFDTYIQDEGVQRLDVRTLAEYSEGHIAKTLNINVLDDSFLTMADSLLQKDKPVALYCRSGKRSKKAAKILSEKGYKVFELDKGFNSWEAAKKEIER
ncbi:rhodanese-like domain-containing protein [Bacteroides sp.]|uniref:rhodanese-like domain-containing protein n=1 Tax=Bacteroides sp. TaxID=29523 RepID=UPI00261D7CF4|nr:rhodanese-like domain-containing protein [Bacteroides sp.]MDD3038520.1 rhodanese-like domain-containing protein [Bacteroides sp.]